MEKYRQEKFRKVVKYYYANGEDYDRSSFDFWFEEAFIFLLGLVFSPFIWIYTFFTEYAGKREAYWEKIKDGKG